MNFYNTSVYNHNKIRCDGYIYKHRIMTTAIQRAEMGKTKKDFETNTINVSLSNIPNADWGAIKT